MAQLFDLFGDPVSPNHGMRGRPQHIPTTENRNKVSMLVALGWGNERIAGSLRITPPSLRKHYFSELKYRQVARDRLDATLAMKLWEGVEAGNVGAIKEFRKFRDENDLMLYGQKDPSNEVKAAKLGKKEQALLNAQQPDTGTPLGELMALRKAAIEPSLN